MTASDFQLRQASNHDVEDLVALTDEVGWGFTSTNWQVAIAAGYNFILRDQGGEIAATSAIFRYGSLSFLANIIVRESYRGQGLATRIINEAERRVDIGQSPIMLVATSDGEPVYKSRGYRTVDTCSQFALQNGADTITPPHMPAYRFAPVTEETLDDIRAFDLELNSFDRGHVLTAMFRAGFPAVALYERESEDLFGFAMATPRQNNMLIGPVIAKDKMGAVALVQMLAYGRQEALRIDLLSHQPDFRASLEDIGFRIYETSPIMLLGSDEQAVRRPNAFAITSQAFG
ncbi:MAG: GNAT family N-acetyltransferase [Sneathiella sp.]